VKIEGINDKAIYEISARNKKKLWTYLFTTNIEDPSVKTMHSKSLLDLPTIKNKNC
jgi:hypothetical protein